MATLSVVLADDHALVRAGFKTLLSDLGGIEVVAETGDGLATVELVEMHSPDLVLMDISMPGLNGLDAAVQINKSSPKTKTIILSMHASESYVRRALQSGVSAYVLKDGSPDELKLAIRAVTQGEYYLSPAVSKSVVQDYLCNQNENDLDRLTPRQREILQLLAEGKTNKEVARLLDLSIKTVDTHRSQIMTRLEIHDITGLVRFAIRNGLVHMDLV